MNNFSGVIGRLKSCLSLKHDADIADLLGLSKTAFAERKRRESIPTDKIALLCKRESINMDWLLTGKGWMYSPDHPETAEAWMRAQLMERVEKVVIVTYRPMGGGGMANGFVVKKATGIISMSGDETRSGYKGTGPYAYRNILKILEDKNYEVAQVKILDREESGKLDSSDLTGYIERTAQPGIVQDELIDLDYEGNRIFSSKRPGAPTAPEIGANKQVFDLGLMKEIIQTVEEIFQKEQLHLPPAKKAELIVLIYEEIAEDRSKISSLPGRVLKLVKLAS